MLADDIAWALPQLRAEAERRMTSRVAVMRLTGDATTVDGYDVPEWVSVHVDLPFRLDSGGSADGGSRGVTVGGVTFEEATGVGHVLAGVVDLKDDDLLEITEGEWAGDVYRVVAAVRYDQKTARRVPIAEVDRPEEWF